MSKTFYFYDASTGLFPGNYFVGTEEDLEFNIPAGHLAYEGQVDCHAVKVDLATGTLMALDKPADTEQYTYVWNDDIKRWLAEMTPAYKHALKEASVRKQRDELMAASDWVFMRANRTGEPVAEAWKVYMQALADVPAQPGFPYEISWPALPE